jgi:hypothetical protein
MITRKSLIAITVLTCFVCDVIAATPSGDADMRAIGRQKFGHDRFATLVIPASTGALNEGIVSGLSAVFGPKKLVRNTASNLKDVHSRNLDLVISGRSREKTKSVLVQALAELPPRSLSGMKIHVVGIDAKELQEASQRVGATIVR